MYKRYIKRILDCILSGIALILLSPIFLIISIFVALVMGKPILFSQERIGKNERPFFLYKFRSMNNAKDKEGKLLPEAKRITKFGRFLRSTSLDELPELWTIFIGKMSFIGPRPMPTYYGPYFYESERERHSVQVGLIPPESILLKSRTTYEEQFNCEVEYARNVSFLLDVKVFFMTFILLVKRMKDDQGSNFRPHLNEYRKNDKMSSN